MIQITPEQWKRIPNDYKGIKQGGIHQCFAGSIDIENGGTRIATEGIDFEIVKEKDNESKG
jgi:hypothetical protein